MDFEALVNEVCRRVMEKIAVLEQQETNCQCSQSSVPKPEVRVSEPDKPVAPKEITITKHVITEKNIIDAHQGKADIIRVDAKAILTDLAREYAAKQRITILRSDSSLNNRGSSL
ncbi:MAG: hypothetical protein PHG16_12350 [Lachnospiraceae bacterium]|nr:hypothetical protein [Lachnospiraceae bacterium]